MNLIFFGMSPEAEEEVYHVCDICSENIFIGEWYHLLYDLYICEDCIFSSLKYAD